MRCGWTRGLELEEGFDEGFAGAEVEVGALSRRVMYGFLEEWEGAVGGLGVV